jgi:uncharacterized protein (TIGR02001 family)
MTRTRATRRLLGLLAAVACGQCAAQSRTSGSLGATSDYVFRGITQSDGRAAAQADAHYQFPSGWFGGVWSSMVRLGRERRLAAEIDGYLGYRQPLGENWDTQLSVVHYEYAGNRRVRELDYDELVATVAYRDNLTLNVSWSPNAARYATERRFAKGRRAASYEIGWATPVHRFMAFKLGAGFYDLQDLFDSGYWYWHAGVGYQAHPWRIELSHIGAERGTRRFFAADLGGNRYVANLLYRF